MKMRVKYDSRSASAVLPQSRAMHGVSRLKQDQRKVTDLPVVRPAFHVNSVAILCAVTQ